MMQETERASRVLLEELRKMSAEEAKARIISDVTSSIKKGAIVRYLALQLGADRRETVKYSSKDEASGAAIAEIILSLMGSAPSGKLSPIKVEPAPSTVGHADRIALMEYCREQEQQLNVHPREDRWWAEASIEQIEQYKKFLNGEGPGDEEDNGAHQEKAPETDPLLSFLPEKVTSDPSCLGVARLIYESDGDVAALSGLLSWDEVKKLCHRIKPVHPSGQKLPATRLDESMKGTFIEALLYTLKEQPVKEKTPRTAPPMRKNPRHPSTAGQIVAAPVSVDYGDAAYDILFTINEKLSDLQQQLNEKGNALRRAIDDYNKIEGQVLEMCDHLAKALPEALLSMEMRNDTSVSTRKRQA